MLAELVIYISVALIGSLFSLRRHVIRRDLLFFLIWSSVYITISLVVRGSNFDGDILVYAEEMGRSADTFYYLREPVVWLGQRFLFSKFNSELLVFIASDAIVGMLLFYAFRRLNMPQYAFFSILIFFPFIMGFQNVYRQLVSSIFFVLAVSLRDKSPRQSFLAYAFAIGSHNVAGIFAPVIFRKGKGKISNIAALLLLIGIPAIIFAAAETKSSKSTGADLTGEYIFALILIFLVFIASRRGVLTKKDLQENAILCYYIFISSSAAMILASAQAERVSMFAMMGIYPILVNLIEEKFSPQVPIRISMVIFGFIPILVFSTRQMLV